MTEEPDPFEAFERSSDMMAYVHSKQGAEGLGTLLDLAAMESEDLERDAKELAALGFKEASDIVTGYVAAALEPECPFPESDRQGWRDWHLNTRPKNRVPFKTKEAAEQCLMNSGYSPDKDGLWRNHSGRQKLVFPLAPKGFTIVMRNTGFNWSKLEDLDRPLSHKEATGWLGTDEQYLAWYQSKYEYGR